MRIRIEIDDTLLKEATKIVGSREKSVIVRMGLEELIRHQRALRAWQPGQSKGKPARKRGKRVDGR